MGHKSVVHGHSSALTSLTPTAKAAGSWLAASSLGWPRLQVWWWTHCPPGAGTVGWAPTSPPQPRAQAGWLRCVPWGAQTALQLMLLSGFCSDHVTHGLTQSKGMGKQTPPLEAEREFVAISCNSKHKPNVAPFVSRSVTSCGHFWQVV